MMPAGFLFTLNNGSSEEDVFAAIHSCVEHGYYSTLVNPKWNGFTAAPLTSTLGDYINMKPGDNVYFFGKRRVYGIGEIVDAFGTGEGAFEVSKGSSSPEFVPAEHSITTINKTERTERWAIIFKPSPLFFFDGIDMDDLLQSNPGAFRSLRTFQKKSFIQFDDEENLAFKSALIRMNEYYLHNAEAGETGSMQCDWQSTVKKLSHCFNSGPGNPAPIDLTNLIASSSSRGSVNREMIVEIALLDSLKHQKPDAVSSFGSWDYLAHQVAASPFKPIDYMDRIDVFGYRWIPGYEGSIISKYLVVEIKKDAARLNDSSVVKDYDQVMKYVDWVCANYAHGDYSMIEAYLVANSFDFSNTSLMKQSITRSYVTGHLAQSHTWTNLHFIEYRAHDNGTITFERM